MTRQEKLEAFRELANIGIRFPAIADTVLEAMEHILGTAKREGNGFPDMNVVTEIREFSHPNGDLINPDIPESVWIDTIRTKTDLDVRAILTELPVETGLYAMQIVYKQGGCLKQGTIKVWVMPVNE